VAGGGSAALLAAVMKRHGAGGRVLFAFDTFEGMPDPGAADTRGGRPAAQLGWGAGTCAAPERSLLALCRRLGVDDVVVPVRGRFEETLPAHRRRLGTLAFVHLDGDWHSSTQAALDSLFDLVVAGGVIQVDDYGYWDGCRRAVVEFERRRGRPLGLRDIDGAGVFCVKA
jgi:hypothetical protein